ncbi:circadian clock protein KaiC [Haladaptatus sp. R4]|uniref:KaiC domain-containing protein n=1 Tax=Haladaptatus sp. R4 TaxID=1679489 RepID=UPI0007B4CB84|nr:KaiC domain-containing protein [Haladaptatus sp. R4]KZN25457.1 circadian clock protein KaiC [Haladaptatus sp. R4]
MSDDDDWFEAALRDEEADDADEVDEANADKPDADEANVDGADADEPDAEEPNADETNADEPDADDPDESDVAAEPGTGAVTDSTDGAADSHPATSPEAESGDRPLFDDDFASAFASAPSMGGSEPDFGDDGGDFDGAAGGNAGAGGFDADEFGGGSGFDGGSGGFGGGPSSTDFDNEEFESAIPRIDIGIDGLDRMIQGGVPQHTLMVAIGNAGTGKTTFGLQFLNHALERGEKAVYVTLEESHQRIVDSATEKGWPYDEYVEDGTLAVVDLDPIEMANSLSSIRSELPELVRDFGATRLVLDSVSLLEMMYEEQATRRNEIYDFTRSLKEAGVTTMLTSEASDDNPYASRHGIIEYLTDAVFVLRYVRSEDEFIETRLAIEIQKIRDANHSRDIKPYDITDEGISVYQQANLF